MTALRVSPVSNLHLLLSCKEASWDGLTGEVYSQLRPFNRVDPAAGG